MMSYLMVEVGKTNRCAVLANHINEDTALLTLFTDMEKPDVIALLDNVNIRCEILKWNSKKITTRNLVYTVSESVITEVS